MRILFLFCAALPLAAQTMAPPVAAMVVNERGNLISVTGVLGNLLPGEPVPLPENEAVLSAAFNAAGGVVKTESQVLILGKGDAVVSVTPAPPGRALFSFASDGSLARTCYPGSDDTLVALGPAKSELVRTGDQLWAGDIAIPGSAPAIWFQGGWLVTARGGLAWVTATESRYIAVPAPVTSLQLASDTTAAVNSRWLLTAKWQLLEIPVQRRRPQTRIR